MPPESRIVPRFAAEPPQDAPPHGRWAERLQTEFLAACLRIELGEVDRLGEVGELVWHPDRSWHGRTFLPATAPTESGLEVFGYVSYTLDSDGQPAAFHASADATSETAESNPDWSIDLCDEVVGAWRGELGNVAAMTLVWGRPTIPGGALVTAELAGLCVDQCTLADDRFTLLAPDDYRGDTLTVHLWDRGGRELAQESLYADEA
ncbi:unannotated protein [freshwater metagenome]|uniref:Unannotated protein n=1 Tax=freshwater metagenome TaxID=449393 RepID=A0A6J7CJN7_9ZZZZ|nr:hypothetical protein [Actinomycetota bacterium]